MNINLTSKILDKLQLAGDKRERAKNRVLEAKQAAKLAKQHLPPGFVVSNRGIYSEADRPLVDKVWRAHGLNDNDRVQVFVVPKNSRIRPGSFIHRPTENTATRRLALQIARLQ